MSKWVLMDSVVADVAVVAKKLAQLRECMDEVRHGIDGLRPFELCSAPMVGEDANFLELELWLACHHLKKLSTC